VLPRKQILAVCLGHALEGLDWSVFAIFSIYFAEQIFPDSGGLALIATLSTYAVAFFFRPLGGVLIGRFSDLHGRRRGLLLTVSLMAGGSLVIGLLPTFAIVGWLAPVLLLLARVAQGMSLGGEISNASAYLAEIAPHDRRARYSSFFYLSAGAALLLASLLGVVLSSVLSRHEMESWGWRIPFILGGVLGLVALWMRRNMAESASHHERVVKARAVRNPLLTTLRHSPKAILQMVGVITTMTMTYYATFSAASPFAVAYRGADPRDAFIALSVGTVVWLALQYPLGALSDRIGRKPLLLAFTGIYGVSIVPLSLLINSSLVNLIIFFTASLVLLSFATSIASTLLAEFFPAAIRGMRIGTWYNLVVAVFGGTAPLLMSALSRSGTPSTSSIFLPVSLW
jgi:MHS family alpha-ketoglutarate permease-like MFS transporter